MVIYGEVLFIENMIIGGVLLYLTGEICRQRVGVLRLIAGSIMCGGFSLVIFWEPDISPAAKGAVMLLMELSFAATVCTVVFGCKGQCCKGQSGGMNKVSMRRLQWQRAAVFILVTYFMGGIVMALLLITKQPGIYTAAGIYTGDMKAAMLAIFLCLGYATIKQIIKTVRNKKLFEEHTYQVEIVIGVHTFKATAFLDTGNRLKDPITGKPVAVASEELWVSLTKEDARYALIPYEAVGTRGMLDAIRTDHVKVYREISENASNRESYSTSIKGCLIARSERHLKVGSKVNDGIGVSDIKYDLLISGEMVPGDGQKG